MRQRKCGKRTVQNQENQIPTASDVHPAESLNRSLLIQGSSSYTYFTAVYSKGVMAQSPDPVTRRISVSGRAIAEHTPSLPMRNKKAGLYLQAFPLAG
jgi:hypothetical protein